jgi:hypothetical protein
VLGPLPLFEPPDPLPEVLELVEPLDPDPPPAVEVAVPAPVVLAVVPGAEAEALVVDVVLPVPVLGLELPVQAVQRASVQAVIAPAYQTCFMVPLPSRQDGSDVVAVRTERLPISLPGWSRPTGGSVDGVPGRGDTERYC